MPQVDYDIASNFPSGVNVNKISDTISASSLSLVFQHTNTEGDISNDVILSGTISFFFSVTLDSGQQTILDNIVAAHDPTAPVLVISASASLTTTNTGNLSLIPDMVLLPLAGSYFVEFSGLVGNSSGSQTIFLAVFVGGLEVTNSRRTVGSGSSLVGTTGNNYRLSFIINSNITVTAGQAIEGRWGVSGGTGIILGRYLRLTE